MDFLSALMFGERVTYHNCDYMIVSHGVGFKLEKKLQFHLAVKTEGDFPAQVYLIPESTSDERF